MRSRSTRDRCRRHQRRSRSDHARRQNKNTRIRVDRSDRSGAGSGAGAPRFVGRSRNTPATTRRARVVEQLQNLQPPAHAPLQLARHPDLLPRDLRHAARHADHELGVAALLLGQRLSPHW